MHALGTRESPRSAWVLHSLPPDTTVGPTVLRPAVKPLAGQGRSLGNLSGVLTCMICQANHMHTCPGPKGAVPGGASVAKTTAKQSEFLPRGRLARPYPPPPHKVGLRPRVTLIQDLYIIQVNGFSQTRRKLSSTIVWSDIANLFSREKDDGLSL